ncbi:AAA family ATPase [Sphingobium sp. AN641]|uniref:AAA family ATPase n=1 Tax=Sphingobium sp. AN641 TaxID=3133443 RepID=UPI0030C5E092
MRSDDYALWIEMGHALKPLGNTGRGLWLDWSATSPKFDPQEAARKWDSFEPQRTGYQAVFARAQANGWINPSSNVAKPDIAATAGEISARPFIAPAVPDIPPRPWLLGRWLLRGAVTTLIAPGGTGKSALMVAAALSLASGRELLGKTVWSGPRSVWLWNLEDDRDELARQLAASILHHDIEEWEYGDRLFINDAGTSLCTATKGRDRLAIDEPVNAALVAEIRSCRIDVLIVDPFVSSHRAEENDNGQMDAIAKRWASIARDTGCSIVLVHHSRKLGGQQVDAEAARGASALGNAARTVLVLNRMDNSEASRLSIGKEDRRSYFRVSNDKTNRAPAEAGDWFHLESVKLGNGGPEGGDSVGVVER